ncbi:MAG: UDP-glucose 4-epimerase GalE [Desulfobacterales bacterium]|nr:UDP-glucose 4-epimerase GalE [Desulfobacterales bacterium]MDJ0855081.1 UDP-glucose 4-epimerase GalE [Desulfobacterales bacterium]
MGKLNILVVGGCGYIGTHMVKVLLEAGHHPVTLDDLSSGHRSLLPGGDFIEGTIADTGLLEDIFMSRRIDAVMHLAGFIEVGESVRDPLKYYGNNFTGTANLLDAMVRHDVKRLVFSSSAAVYGEPESTPIDEGHPLNPTSPYGDTKLWVEKMLLACDRAHGMRAISLRYFNAAGADESATIGERHEPESHLIPLVLEVARGAREHIRIFGVDYPTPDGTCIRDYIHVSDLVSAHLAAIEALMDGAGSNVYNLGNSRGISVREIIATARRVSGQAIPIVEDKRRPGDPAVLIAGSTKIKNELNWQPRFEHIEDIVRTAWSWHVRS